MARAPIQVLVIPFRHTNIGVEYAVFQRSDESIWQFVAGGAEDDETPLMAAQREAFEEARIDDRCEWIELDSQASIRRTEFARTEHWPASIYVVPEIAFGVDVSTCLMALSHEHTAVRWCSYAVAQEILKWDSNRTALWELNERLKPVGAWPVGDE